MATYVASEDFCSFKQQLKIGQIKNDFYSGQIKRTISVLNIRANIITDAFIELNKLLFKKLGERGPFFINLLTLRNIKSGLKIYRPFKQNLGLWDRIQEPNGLYEIINYFAERYKDYCSISPTFTKHYFSIGTTIIYDKPSYHCINSDVKAYTNILYCNCDEKAKQTLNYTNIENPPKFLFPVADFPIQLHNFRSKNYKIISDFSLKKNPKMLKKLERKYEDEKLLYSANIKVDKWMKYLHILKSIKYAKYLYIKNDDIWLVLTAIGLGCIPIVERKIEVDVLKENEHYLINKNKIPSDVNCQQIHSNLMEFYKKYMDPDQQFKLLMNNLFIRNIE